MSPVRPLGIADMQKKSVDTTETRSSGIRSIKKEEV